MYVFLFNCLHANASGAAFQVAAVDLTVRVERGMVTGSGPVVVVKLASGLVLLYTLAATHLA